MGTIDTTPFLTPPHPQSPPTPSPLRRAARILRRGIPTTIPGAAVREAAAQEIEERQDDWTYSPPVIALDAAWNSAFITATIIALSLSRDDCPRLPLRLWLVAYSLQCFVHLLCVFLEFRRRRYQRIGGLAVTSSVSLKKLESANTMFSCIWWLIGFYWISIGGHPLQEDSPTLYWLCIAFLILDLFVVIFCVALASVIAAAVCCCLPCIIAILYVLADRVGASKEDIEVLPRYTFHKVGSEEKINEEISGPCGGIMKECGTDSPLERTLDAEDAECCICLSAYEDDVELRELPCNHHFHSICVDKWLYINSTCPLCKYDVSKRCTSEEV